MGVKGSGNQWARILGVRRDGEGRREEIHGLDGPWVETY